ncbi:MAG: MaoC/PaaZ C-terminal domain-containing protein [Actinomycetota bacterium]
MAIGISVTRELRRELLLTADMLRAYSRRGNYHSEPDEARRLGLPGLVAQGLQVAGPAYGLLLDEWGEAFLAHGELELKFVGMVLDDQTVDAGVTIEGDEATLEVSNRDTGKVAAVGRARRSGVLEGR